MQLVRGLSVSVRGQTGHFLLYTDSVKCWCVCVRACVCVCVCLCERERDQVNRINRIYFLCILSFLLSQLRQAWLSLLPIYAHIECTPVTLRIV